MNKSCLIAIIILNLCLPAATEAAQEENATGILVLAHGTRSHGTHRDGDPMDEDMHEHPPAWERTVEEVVRQAAAHLEMDVELAFGMWNRESFQEGVDTLAGRNIEILRVVPLYVSSHSLVIRAQHHLFGFENGRVPFDPGRIAYPPGIRRVEYAAPLDDHPILSEILTDRARALAERPEAEELVLVAHGPVREDDDLLWLEDLAVHAERIQTAMAVEGRPFARIHYLTLRDDAPPPIRDHATRELRELVAGIARRGHEPLILPVLLAPAGIDEGLLRRLENLSYRYRGEMIAPHPRLVAWLVEAARMEGVNSRPLPE